MTASSQGLQDVPENWSAKRKVAAIAAVSAGSILSSLDGNIANVALPTLAHDLNIPASSAVILVSAYNLVLAMTLLPFAALGGRFGHDVMFRSGFSLYIMSAIGCTFSTHFELLVLFRALQALSTAALLCVSTSLIRSIYSPSSLGRGMGFNTMVASTGAAAAPVLGAFILSTFSSHWVFATGIPLAIIGLLTTKALPPAELIRAPYDVAGALMCAATFGLLIFGFQALSEGISPYLATTCALAGFVIAAIFVRYECKVSMPVLPVDLLSQAPMALSVASLFFAVMASTSSLLYLPFFLASAGTPTAMIGAMITPFAIAIMICAPSAGMLSDRVSPQILGLAGLTLATISIASYIWQPTDPSYWDIAWRTALSGVGFALFFSPNARLMVSSSPRHRVAGASSLLSTTRMFGQALGSAILSGILATHMSAKWAFASVTVLVTIAWVCSALRMVLAEPRHV